MKCVSPLLDIKEYFMVLVHFMVILFLDQNEVCRIHSKAITCMTNYNFNGVILKSLMQICVMAIDITYCTFMNTP